MLLSRVMNSTEECQGYTKEHKNMVTTAIIIIIIINIIHITTATALVQNS